MSRYHNDEKSREKLQVNKRKCQQHDLLTLFGCREAKLGYLPVMVGTISRTR